MSSTTMRQQCPRTGKWFNAEQVKILFDKNTGQHISRMTFPVTIREEGDQLYELSDCVSAYISKPSNQRLKRHELINLEPVRYPGFKNYEKTKDLLRLITDNKWHEETDSSDVPSLQNGYSMATPEWPAYIEANYTKLQYDNVNNTMKAYWDKEEKEKTLVNLMDKTLSIF